jgi:hypothetical protein
MSISGVGAANYVSQVHPQHVARTAPRQSTPAVAATGRDADGDNDGSKGGTVDIRA